MGNAIRSPLTVHKHPSLLHLLLAGKYVITRQINIRNPVVLRGAGRDSTTLYFPKSLSEARGNSWPGGKGRPRAGAGLCVGARG